MDKTRRLYLMSDKRIYLLIKWTWQIFVFECIVSFLLLPYIRCEFISNYYMFIPGKKFVLSVIEEGTFINQYECTRHCLDTSSCKSIAWNSLAKTCQLANVDSTHESVVNNQMEDDPAYLAYAKYRYPVFFAQNEGYSNFTFDEAKAKCRRVESIIATSTEIIKAYSAGMKKCTCGWIASGINVAIDDPIDTNCKNVENIDNLAVCDRSAAGVWCKF